MGGLLIKRSVSLFQQLIGNRNAKVVKQGYEPKHADNGLKTLTATNTFR